MKFDKTNMIYGLIATAGVAVFGQYWFLFAGFLVFNVIDYITGWIKARFNKTESSAVGAKGIVKKVSYWVIIGMAFYIAYAFVSLGILLGIDLVFVQFFGWFTLATYLINEIRSILENLIAIGVHVPAFLVKGLEVSAKLLDAKAIVTEDDEEKTDEYRQ